MSMEYQRMKIKDKFYDRLMNADQFLFQHLAELSNELADGLWDRTQWVSDKSAKCFTERGSDHVKEKYDFDLLIDSALMMDKASASFELISDAYRFKIIEKDQSDKVKWLQEECAKMGYAMIPVDKDRKSLDEMIDEEEDDG